MKRAGAYDGVQPELLVCHMQPGLQVVEVTLREVLDIAGHVTFVPVPGDVCLHGVETGLLDFLKAVAPQLLRYAEVVECGAEDKDVPTFDGEAVVVVLHTLGV